MRGDRLKAIAREVSASKRMGHYEVNIFNQKEELVAWFKGTVYKKKKYGSKSAIRLCCDHGRRVGSRFWPASTDEKPKQFLDILG